MPASAPASPRAPRRSRAVLLLSLTACALLSACGTWRNDETNPAVSTGSVFDSLRPYRIEVVQGNVITQEVMSQIQPGLGRAQVRDILGTPLLADIFHADRWDYVFTIARQGVPAQQRKVTVFFKNDTVERFDADALPSERDFVSSISKPVKGTAPPNLTPAQVSALPAPEKRLTPKSKAPVGAVRDYPPLESGIR